MNVAQEALTQQHLHRSGKLKKKNVSTQVERKSGMTK